MSCKGSKVVSPKDFWEAHPYQSILTRIGAKVAKTQDAAEEAEEEAPTCNKRNARKKRKKAKEKGEEGGEDVVTANLAKGGKGHHDKGKGGKHNKGAKGGRGGKPSGNTTTPSSKVLCDSRTCTRMINPRRDVPNPLLCAPCTKYQEDNLGRFGPYYLNRQFQQRDFVSKERPAEDDARGRKRDRHSDKERPSRRHSEGDRARSSSKGYETKRGYSATVEKLTTALDTALDTIKALQPKARARSRSRSRSNQRFRRSRSREEDSDESPRRYR